MDGGIRLDCASATTRVVVAPDFEIPKSESNTGIVTYPLCLKEQVTVQAPYGNENWELPDHSFPSLLGREGIKVKHLLAVPMPGFFCTAESWAVGHREQIPTNIWRFKPPWRWGIIL